MTKDEHIEMRRLAYEHAELKGINSSVTDFIAGYMAAYKKFKQDETTDSLRQNQGNAKRTKGEQYRTPDCS